MTLGEQELHGSMGHVALGGQYDQGEHEEAWHQHEHVEHVEHPK